MRRVDRLENPIEKDLSADAEPFQRSQHGGMSRAELLSHVKVLAAVELNAVADRGRRAPQVHEALVGQDVAPHSPLGKSMSQVGVLEVEEVVFVKEVSVRAKFP